MLSEQSSLGCDPMGKNIRLIARQILRLMLAVAICSCGPRPSSLNDDKSQSREAWDLPNDPIRLDLQPVYYDDLVANGALRGTTMRKPWKDSYWPYFRKNIALRYTTNAEFTSYAEQAANALADHGDPRLSPAEKYDLLSNDLNLSLTRESWARYESHSARYGDDSAAWSWMGICNGWAAASINEVAPRNPVLAVNTAGQEILFFEGDIRALLSKAYDMNRMSEPLRMLGMRCNDDPADVPVDDAGRPLDGIIKGAGKSFSIRRDYLASNGAIEVQDRLGGDPYWLVSKDKMVRANGEAAMWIYRDRASVAADVAANTRGQRAIPGPQVAVRFFRSCRDVNPAALHQALTAMLSERASPKNNFILELSRNREVWNHPVWGFESKLGELYPITDEPESKRIFRAPGTAWIVDAITQVLYVHGAPPRIRYPEDDTQAPVQWDHIDTTNNRYAILQLKYSLEFDATGKLIGGEWSDDPTGRQAFPDFFWRTYGQLTDTGRNGDESLVRYSLVKQLVECSQNEPDTQIDIDIDGMPTTFAAVRCGLSHE